MGSDVPEQMFIGIAGVIGAGKTTLTKNLGAALGYKTSLEPVEANPYLEDFYHDMARWTFPMQLFLLAHRFKQHQEIIWSGAPTVQDRTIYEDTIFARIHNDDGLMDERDYATYTSHFNIMRRYLVYPDVLVYLHVTPEQAMERIRLRQRDVEKDIPVDYMVKLYEGYEAFAKEMERYTLVLRIDWSTYLPTEEVAEQITSLAAKNQDFVRSLRRI